MKNLLKYPLVGLLTIMACHSDNLVAPQKVVDGLSLGAVSKSAIIAGISSNIVSGYLDLSLIVTPNAMYSLQLTDITGKLVHNTGFIATHNTELKSLDYRNIPNGSYDLTLIDTNGNLTKVPVIIKH
jgi:hypothetical protein